MSSRMNAPDPAMKCSTRTPDGTWKKVVRISTIRCRRRLGGVLKRYYRKAA